MYQISNKQSLQEPADGLMCSLDNFPFSGIRKQDIQLLGVLDVTFELFKPSEKSYKFCMFGRIWIKTFKLQWSNWFIPYYRNITTEKRRLRTKLNQDKIVKECSKIFSTFLCKIYFNKYYIYAEFLIYSIFWNILYGDQYQITVSGSEKYCW